jgi:nitroimidazol reductase NimA-like FMN-containing flavoprotein (pyridoxamine 5'-phosphate oxidase superfamily)
MMRHEDVVEVLNEPLARELLGSGIPARLAYNGLDGSPRVVPIGFLWNGAELVLSSVSYAAKVKALLANPKVALTIDTNEPPWRILLVRGTASVEIVDGVVPEYLTASRKGTPEEQWDTFEAEVRSLYKQMARIAVTPEWAKLIDFETTLPSAVERAIRERAAST